MIVEGFHINGFGIFSQMEIRGFSPGLNIILGGNEAGKSTILAFLRVMLFGFPRNTTGTNTYPPLKGGAHGGSLILASDNGPIVLNRSPGAHGGNISLSYPDGTKGTGDDLQRLLAGATPTLFNNVYAFGLSELQTIQSLTNEEVASALYGASLGAGVRSLAAARKQISQRQGDLFKPTGKKPEINQKISEFKENAALITQAARDADIYLASVKALESIQQELNSLNPLKIQLNKKIRFCENILGLWGDWLDYAQALSRLEEIPQNFVQLPENSLSLLESLNDKIGSATEEILALQEELAGLQNLAASLEVETGLIDQGEPIVLLNSEYAGYRINLENVQRHTLQLDAKNAEIQSICTSLGAGWTLERLAGFEGSLFLKQDLDRHEKALSIAAQANQQASSQVILRQESVDEILEEIHRRAEAANKAGTTPHAWEQAFQAGQDPLAASRDAGNKLAELLSRKEFLEQELAHQTQRMTDKAVFAWRRRGYFAAVFLFGGALLAGTGLMIYGLEWYAPLSAVALGMIAGAMYLARITKSPPPERFIIKLGIRDQEFARMGTGIEAQQAKLREIEEDMGRLSAGLGIAVPQTNQEILDFIAHTDFEFNRFRSWMGFRTDLEECRARGKAAAKRLDAARETAMQTQISLASCEAAWQDWLKGQEFPTSLSPVSAREALSLMETGAALLREASIEELQLVQCRSKVQEFEDNLRQLTMALSLPFPKPGLVQASLQELGSRLDKSRENQAVQKQVASGMETVEFKIKEKVSRLDNLNCERKNLLASAQAQSEQEFLEKCRLSREQISLENQLERAASGIRNVSGEKDIQGLLGRLSTMSRDECLARLQEANNELKCTEDALQDLTGKYAELKADMRRLASDTKVSLLRTKEGEIAEQIKNLSFQWGAYTLAGLFLERAVSFLEEEQQPEVITRAGTLFKEITDGRYERIYAPLGEKSIELIMTDGTRKNPEQLSRGTAELLYLCIRMGYIQARAKQGANLPVVMDDVLVNFDATRATQAAHAISGLARGHQVFLFTCHKPFLKLFGNPSPDFHLYTLHQGKLAPA
ncbi:MAG: AAA family ATPase [Desulfatibacillum sp.]|nr:AAA family ATPase [Desulfatibacillum sp.]